MSSAAVPLSALAVDPTVYPVSDDMGEGTLQRLIAERLRPHIERWFEARGTPTFVGADQYFYWKQFEPSERIAPDVYVLPGAPLIVDVGAWKVWETGLIPSFAFEIVSRDVDKHYLLSPAKYSRLGVEELIVFDPEAHESRSRARWQVFRRNKRGLLLRVASTDADRVKSRVLGCHLRVVGEGGATRVRIATGINGETLFPTEAEARAKAEAERAQAEAERAQAEAAELEAEREARAALEAELARLRARQKRPRK
jgi:hypothetical protein